MESKSAPHQTIPVCAIDCFDFSLPTEDEKCFTASWAVFAIVLGALFVIGVALLGWASFEFDTVQGNG